MGINIRILSDTQLHIKTDVRKKKIIEQRSGSRIQNVSVARLHFPPTSEAVDSGTSQLLKR